MCLKWCAQCYFVEESYFHRNVYIHFEASSFLLYGQNKHSIIHLVASSVHIFRGKGFISLSFVRCCSKLQRIFNVISLNNKELNIEN